jgi:hypothetical protein
MKEHGIKNTREIDNSIKKIELLTTMYKRKRMTEEAYIKGIHEALSKMTDQRNYIEYLSNIGQL